MMLVLAADHAGFELKEKLKAYLRQQGKAVDDCGVFSS
ncbi:MAG: RpiB/LacA/LacB family sugar-phosphate isomerase, partial [Candidatus Aminicenantes bacterium]|nr:RpiB/LacA/LacB family sugar-phosphate isomerase [Candidatus Aminicenantes bacterium]